MTRAALAVCVLAALFARAAFGAQETQAPHWHALPVAGGLDAVARAAGIEPGLPSWRVLYEACRGRHGVWGEDAGSVATEEQAQPARPGSVPLPLAPPFWRSLIRKGKEIPDDQLAVAIVGDRRAALSYRGLVAFDEETLAALAREPDTLLRIARRNADLLAVFACRFAVRAGSVVLPGGPDTEPIWRELVGESPGRPARFLLRLLERDLGRLAFFYDSLARLDPKRQRFALGLAAEGGPTPVEPAAALYATFARETTWWRVGRGAFARPDADAARLLREVRITDDARVAPPASQAFWTAVFENRIPAGSDEKAAAVDAAWLAARIGSGDARTRLERLEQLAFAQRVFGAAAEAEPAAAAEAVAALPQARALLLSLERSGVRDPSAFAAAGRAAREWARSFDSDEKAPLLAVGQAALAVVDRARFHGAIDAAAAERLARAAFAVPVSPLAQAQDAMIGFVEGTLVPELARAVGGAGSDAERVVLRAMAGSVENRPSGPAFDWEGLDYRCQPDRAELARLLAVRKRQGAAGLGEVLRACRTRGAAGGRSACVRDLGATLVSLVYAAHLGPADGPALRGVDPSRRHGFGSEPWALAVEVTGQEVPWHVVGSLLGLETALSRLALHRLDQDAMPERLPVIDAAQRRRLAVSAGLARALDLRDEDRDGLAGAVAAGRARALALGAGSPDVVAAARDANLDPWRARALEWLLVHDTASLPGFFSLGELAWLGAPSGGAWQDWGSPDPNVAGLRLRMSPPRALDEGSGRRPEPTIAESFVGLNVRIAVHLSERGLPASLAPALASTLLPDLFDEARPVSPDDRLALESWAREKPADRIDDAVASLVGRGPLQPAGSGRAR